MCYLLAFFMAKISHANKKSSLCPTFYKIRPYGLAVNYFNNNALTRFK